MLILDCCFAAQAARAANLDDRVVPLNVELLAACSMNEKTPLADHHSFTSIFIKTLKGALKQEGSSVTISQISDALTSHEAELNGTPHRQGIGPTSRTIRLQHLHKSTKELAAYRPETTVQLSVQLKSGINSTVLQELVTFLKYHAPEVVCGVECIRIIVFAEAASEYIDGPKTRSITSVDFDELGEAPKSSISVAWSECTSMIFRLVSFLKAAPNGNTMNDTITVLTAEKEAFIMEKLEEAMKSLEQTLALAVLSANIASKEEAFRRAMDNPSLKKLGVLEFLRLRLLQSEFSEIPPEMEGRYIMSSGSPFSQYSPNLVREEEMGQKAVLVEYKHYHKSFKHDSHTRQVQDRRVGSLAAALRAATSQDYLSLECLKWFHDQERCRYGLTFKLPFQQATRPYSLREVLSEQGSLGRAGLKERFEIAKKIGRALLRWHTSEWLHQGIASHNIIFFHDPKTSKIDFLRPYLCGFEFSRKANEISSTRTVADFSLDVYRHPNRQGLPQLSHRIEHDLYSFGVILLDIGLWQSVESFFKVEESKPLPPPVDIREKILKNVHRLHFYMGPEYTKAVGKCIKEEWGTGKGHLEIAKEFKLDVLDKIHSGSGL